MTEDLRRVAKSSAFYKEVVLRDSNDTQISLSTNKRAWEAE